MAVRIDHQRGHNEQLARSWDANAGAWTRAIRSRAVESRRVATDAAIIDAVRARSPRRILDAGCGEGWLTRALAVSGVDVVGVDASAALIESARAAGGGDFRHLTYEELAADPERLGTFDAVVCNFALLHEDIEPLLHAFSRNLTDAGALLIQTVHPWSARGTDRYVDGWRTEEFSGFGDEFVEPMPWYFRTVGSWSRAIHGAGFTIEQLAEPAHPETAEPLSLLIIAVPAGS